VGGGGTLSAAPGIAAVDALDGDGQFVPLGFPSSDVNRERTPPLDLDVPAIDQLARGDRPAAPLGADFNRELPSDPERGDDPGELGDVVRDLGAVLMEATRVRRQGGGPPRRGLLTRSSPSSSSIPGGRRAGGDFATSNSVAVLLPNPDFQHLVRVQSPLRHAELAASVVIPTLVSHVRFY
jgi:hypothetical protein